MYFDTVKINHKRHRYKDVCRCRKKHTEIDNTELGPEGWLGVETMLLFQRT